LECLFADLQFVSKEACSSPSSGEGKDLSFIYDNPQTQVMHGIPDDVDEVNLQALLNTTGRPHCFAHMLPLAVEQTPLFYDVWSGGKLRLLSLVAISYRHVSIAITVLTDLD
jgi:hypothetical protein